MGAAAGPWPLEATRSQVLMRLHGIRTCLVHINCDEQKRARNVTRELSALEPRSGLRLVRLLRSIQ